ncbi:chemotaxis response regulator protein-glutamate methylesterase [Domibacillus sp. DTU_2020_1001157_1_SI_ALB_TIR_016]|uniref:protein-glutamate methylesterase/protein-glutamine glutaminase n=1 Tax=Domibacillus sp. DTU_2020_1001157_1_SI_ALB_TIR_016 TaxID=3077789 RepID=UPI0028EC9D47|nr:chemotaxis response regulator protein-glutamate methylesterase [Domibacillus sp. DTU_2020_1001157_1_SI_ALB_TIR_016]WNS79709.1 chemotaxis response regulator protein-glutamate methylesterase [Domibacillus sp. DTU_2020_1001157_1_SI_ALB_TIR_016]
MNAKRVLVVDDSAFMRKLISEFLSEHPQLEVIAFGRNGRDGVKKALELKPDVITLDVEMPEMDGLEALKAIMEKQPCPVVMLSSLTKEGTETTLKAIELGAVDFIAKPSGTISLDLHKIKDVLIEKVLGASKANISMQPAILKKTAVISPPAESEYTETNTVRPQVRSKKMNKLVLIATSTGGPRALQHVVTKLPASLPAPVVIVQHMPPGFTKSLSDRLDSLSEIRVKEGKDGEILQNGTVYIAPGGKHLRLKKTGTSTVIALDELPPEGGHRPAANATFRSAAAIHDLEKTAVIMTGMGSDGAEGLITLKETGTVKAIAEAKETCVVYGMPKAAIATHLVDDVVPVDEIASAIVKHVYNKR